MMSPLETVGARGHLAWPAEGRGGSEGPQALSCSKNTAFKGVQDEAACVATPDWEMSQVEI